MEYLPHFDGPILFEVKIPSSGQAGKEASDSQFAEVFT
jgi:hypothetical protein